MAAGVRPGFAHAHSNASGFSASGLGSGSLANPGSFQHLLALMSSNAAKNAETNPKVSPTSTNESASRAEVVGDEANSESSSSHEADCGADDRPSPSLTPPGPAPDPATGDIGNDRRSSSIAALRLRAKEYEMKLMGHSLNNGMVC